MANETEKGSMQIYRRYDELLERLATGNREPRVLGCAPDGAPIVCVRAGGDKLPAILISAGSHSTEQAAGGAHGDPGLRGAARLSMPWAYEAGPGGQRQCVVPMPTRATAPGLHEGTRVPTLQA